MSTPSVPTGLVASNVTTTTCTLSWNASSNPGTSIATGPASGAWFGWYEAGGSKPLILAAETTFGRKVDYYRVYYAMNGGSGSSFPTPDDKKMYAGGLLSGGQDTKGGGRMAVWGLTTLTNITGQPSGLLAGVVPAGSTSAWPGGKAGTNNCYTYNQITSGALDAYFIDAFTTVKAWGEPCWFNLDHEMDGNSRTIAAGGAAGGGGNRAAAGTRTEFAAAWRYLYNMAASIGATNIAWAIIYASQNSNATQAVLNDFYPGDAYVDWIGGDPYNTPTPGGGWSTFEQTATKNGFFPTKVAALSAGAAAKPFMLGEYGCNYDPNLASHRATWIGQMPATITAHPMLKGTLYFNSGSYEAVLLDTWTYSGGWHDTGTKDTLAWNAMTATAANAVFNQPHAGGGIGISQYNIYRDAVALPIASATAPATTIDLPGPYVPGSNHTFQVTAVDSTGTAESAKSSPVSVTFASLPQNDTGRASDSLTRTGTQNIALVAAGNASDGLIVSKPGSSATVFNTFESVPDATLISVGNSAGSDGSTAVTSVQVPASGTINGDTTISAHGTTSLQIATGATAGSCLARWSLGSVPTVFTRVYLYMSAAPTVARKVLQLNNVANSVNCGGILITSTGLIQSQYTAGGIAYTSGSAIAFGQWVRLEFKVVSNATAGSVEVKYWANADSAGAPDLTNVTTAVNTGAGDAGLVMIGNQAGTANVVAYWLDDFAAGTTDWIGPVAVTTPPLSDTAAGTDSLTKTTGAVLTHAVLWGEYYVTPRGDDGPYYARQCQIGRLSGIASYFMSFDTVASQHTEWTAAATRGQVLLIAWQPSRTVGLFFSDILAGVYDNHINTTLAFFAALPVDVVIRFGHEMNGNYMQWSPLFSGSASSNCTSAAQFAQVWQYMVGKAVALNATNIKWLFSPNQNDSPGTGGTPLETFYPGDAYVDCVGYSSYNGLNGLYMTAQQTFRGKTNGSQADTYDRVCALNATAPVWVSETGCVDLNDPKDVGNLAVGHSKAQWFTDMWALDTSAFPRLEAVSWFDASGTRNWVLDSSSTAFTAYQAGFLVEPYVHAPTTAGPGVAFRSATSGTPAGTAATISPTNPAGTVDGDLLIVFIGWNTSTQPTSLTVPTGWTAIDPTGISDTAWWQAYWKLASSEGASWTWSWVGATRVSWAVASYAGCDPLSPIRLKAEQAEASASATTTHTTPTITANAGDFVVGLFGDRTSTIETWAAPPGYFERVEQTTSASFTSVEICDSNGVVTPGSLSLTATSSVASTTASAWVLALKSTAYTMGWTETGHASDALNVVPSPTGIGGYLGGYFTGYVQGGIIAPDGAATAANTGASQVATQLAIVMPACQTGSVVVIGAGLRVNGVATGAATCTPPGGVTERAHLQRDASPPAELFVWTWTSNGTTPTHTFAFTGPTGNTGYAISLVAQGYAGVDTTTPIDSLTLLTEASSVAQHATSAVVAPATTSWGLALFADRNSSSWTPAAPLVERADTAGGVDRAAVELCDTGGSVTAVSHSYVSTGTATTAAAVMALGYLRQKAAGAVVATLVDVGRGTQSQSIAATATWTDGGSAADSEQVSTVIAPSTDAGTGATILVVAANASVTDNASADDEINVAAPQSLSDAASVDDAMVSTSLILLGDSATAADQVNNVALNRLSDTAVGGMESDSVSATASWTDAGVAANDLDANAATSVNDSATGSDSVAVSQLGTAVLSESGNAADIFNVAGTRSWTETASAADVLVVAAPTVVNDSASVLDSLSVSVVSMLGDGAAAVDALSVAASNSLGDIAAATESILVSGTRTLSDSATVSDVLQQAPTVVLSDSGTSSDRLVTTATLRLSESASVFDTLQFPGVLRTMPQGVGVTKVLTASGGLTTIIASGTTTTAVRTDNSQSSAAPQGNRGNSSAVVQ